MENASFGSRPGDPTPRPDDVVTIAVLDGAVDSAHECLVGADLRVLAGPVPGTAHNDPLLHGTHVASLLFGRPGTGVRGLAPQCRGLLIPVFRQEERVSQVDLARAVELAVLNGADVINISGGEPVPTGEPDDILAAALRLCETEGVVVVAAVGNDGADLAQVPAAVTSVLAVGACTDAGEPLPTNNWGVAFAEHGLLAPGQDVVGARPGGGVVELTGSSFAVPAVSAAVAALLAHDRRHGLRRPAADVREILLDTAFGRDPPGHPASRRMRGRLDLPAALTRLTQKDPIMDTAQHFPAPTSTDAPPGAMPAGPAGITLAAPPPADPPGVAHHPASAGVTAACAPVEPLAVAVTPAIVTVPTAQPVFAIGTIGWDFGTEARRDGFVQQMDVVPMGERLIPANPYDPQQISTYLAENPWASDKIIWTCNLEGRTPIYALEAELPVGLAWGGPRPGDADQSAAGLGYPPVSVVYKTFRDAIVGQSLIEGSPNRISRVSVPGTLTGRTVRLFSGQVVPVVVVHAQGLYTWNESVLLDGLVTQVNSERSGRKVDPVDPEHVRLLVRAFLDKVYYQFRNLGLSGPDRALNYAATNAFELTRSLIDGFLSGRLVPRRGGEPEPLYALDDITVAKSRYSRPDSDSYDVTLVFMDPENDRRSRIAYLMTVDVSTSPPVSLAPVHQFMIR